MSHLQPAFIAKTKAKQRQFKNPINHKVAQKNAKEAAMERAWISGHVAWLTKFLGY